MGVTFCQNHSLPIYYNFYPGSIVDVTTLKNCIKYLKIFNLKDVLFVLDRGFFSKANVLEMNNSKSEVSFVLPMPFSLKKVKTLVKKINDCCQTLPAPLNTMKKYCITSKVPLNLMEILLTRISFSMKKLKLSKNIIFSLYCSSTKSSLRIKILKHLRSTCNGEN